MLVPDDVPGRPAGRRLPTSPVGTTGGSCGHAQEGGECVVTGTDSRVHAAHSGRSDVLVTLEVDPDEHHDGTPTPHRRTLSARIEPRGARATPGTVATPSSWSGSAPRRCCRPGGAAP